MKTEILIVSTAVVLFFAACEKKEPVTPQSPEPTPYRVRLTDAPGPYTAVNVDIQGVEIITGSGSAANLSVNPGIYNLLNFTNGVDTLIATGSLMADRVQQIRLILGPNNSVAVGGTTFPLSTPSAEQSGLKLQVHQTLQAGVAYEVLLDFDAAQSIVLEGNGTYKLKPVIRTINTAISGAIRGSVTPGGVATIVTAGSGGNAYSTAADAQGQFILKGLPAGTYTLGVQPVSPYAASTTSNITVVTGITTTLSPISI